MATRNTPATKRTGKAVSVPAPTKAPAVDYKAVAGAALALLNSMDGRKALKAATAERRKALESMRPALEKAGMRFDAETLERVKKLTGRTMQFSFGVQMRSQDAGKPALPKGDPWRTFLREALQLLDPEVSLSKLQAMYDGPAQARNTYWTALRRFVTVMSPAPTGKAKATTPAAMAEAAGGRIGKAAGTLNDTTLRAVVAKFEQALRSAMEEKSANEADS